MLGLKRLKLREPVRLNLHLRLNVLDLGEPGGVLLRLTHQRADLLGERVARGAQLVGLGYRGAARGVELQSLVHQRQLLVLKLLFNVLAHELRVLAQQFNVYHCDYSQLYNFSFSRPFISASRSSAP